MKLFAQELMIDSNRIASGDGNRAIFDVGACSTKPENLILFLDG
jgi:hypothetical protein